MILRGRDPRREPDPPVILRMETLISYTVTLSAVGGRRGLKRPLSRGRGDGKEVL